MTTSAFISADAIRTLFSVAMSEMYKSEVPQYRALTQLVADVNGEALARSPELEKQLKLAGERHLLGIERHGAIRIGTAEELSIIRRLFAVMGMAPVGYYDLSVAAVPVHSTAFRPIKDEALRRNPFRVFTSLLRLDLLEDIELRRAAAAILARRNILTQRRRELLGEFETKGGLNEAQAREFVSDAIQIFRWRSEATVGVALAFGLTVLTGVYAVAHISGGHFNPAVTIGLWTSGRTLTRNVVPYIVVQVAGAVAAAFVLKFVAQGHPGFELGAFASNGYGDLSPGKYNLQACAVIEALLTFFFLFVIIGSISARAPAGFAGLAIGLALTLVNLVGIPVTNCSVNRRAAPDRP